MKIKNMVLIRWFSLCKVPNRAAEEAFLRGRLQLDFDIADKPISQAKLRLITQARLPLFLFENLCNLFLEVFNLFRSIEIICQQRHSQKAAVWETRPDFSPDSLAAVAGFLFPFLPLSPPLLTRGGQQATLVSTLHQCQLGSISIYTASKMAGGKYFPLVGN